MLAELSMTSTTRRARDAANGRIGSARAMTSKARNASCTSSESRCRSFSQSDRGFFSSKICRQNKKRRDRNPPQADLQDVEDNDRQRQAGQRERVGWAKFMRPLPRRASFAGAARRKGRGRGPRAADAVCVAVAADGFAEIGEELAVLAQVPLGHGHFPDRARLDVEQLEVAFELGLGFMAVENLDDVRLVAMVAEEVEPTLESRRDRTGR